MAYKNKVNCLLNEWKENMEEGWFADARVVSQLIGHYNDEKLRFWVGIASYNEPRINCPMLLDESQLSTYVVGQNPIWGW